MISIIKNAERFGLSEERYSQMYKRFGGDEDEILRCVQEWGVEACERGYAVFQYGNSSMYQVLRIDDIEVFETDDEAVEQAIKDGMKFISVDELPANIEEEEKYLGWIDTPENRRAVAAHCMWRAIYKKYPADRGSMSREQETAFVNECFNAYETEGFAKKFWSQGGDYPQYYGKPFNVIGRVGTDDADLECLPMWNICFENGFKMAAYPDEIIPSEMRNNGCNMKDI